MSASRPRRAITVAIWRVRALIHDHAGRDRRIDGLEQTRKGASAEKTGRVQAWRRVPSGSTKTGEHDLDLDIAVADRIVGPHPLADPLRLRRRASPSPIQCPSMGRVRDRGHIALVVLRDVARPRACRKCAPARRRCAGSTGLKPTRLGRFGVDERRSPAP